MKGGLPAFGAAEIMTLLTMDEGGIEEVIVGLFGGVAEHLTTDCLESVAAIVGGVLDGRAAGVGE